MCHFQLKMSAVVSTLLNQHISQKGSFGALFLITYIFIEDTRQISCSLKIDMAAFSNFSDSSIFQHKARSGGGGVGGCTLV